MNLDFLTIRFLDIIDIIVAGYLIYLVYKLLRGTIAFNIFVGMGLLFSASSLVRLLDMKLLSRILDQFVNVGVLALIVIFQPEIRRFLLLLGDTTLKGRTNILNQVFGKTVFSTTPQEDTAKEVKNALLRMSRIKTGALIVFADGAALQDLVETGVVLNADVSQQLLESIFQKESPLHDGAILISNGKIHAASCILPISNNLNLPQKMGLRHRAAVGITEITTCSVFTVSEETGRISFFREGKWTEYLKEDNLELLLRNYAK
jgi:diadenylate cyclase